tara:strand:+ start:4849 stop:5304 length:456 start_codon:yes stop_codon:yes gene_type:complete
MEWEEYYRNIVHQVKLKSKDEKTKIGAIVVGRDGEILSTGYNSFPRGINDNIPERQVRPEKYFWFAHAELNSIVNAARIGVSTKGSAMYVTCGIPCSDCAKAIVNAGIDKVVCETAQSAKDIRWVRHADRSLIMFEEAGVTIEYYEGTYNE